MKIYLVVLLVFISLGCSEEPKSVVPKDVSSDRLDWFREAKFGMFIHWGPYSNLEGEWDGRRVPVGENAEWVMQKLQIPRDTYRDLAHNFNPIEFDAAAWVNLARSTGMKYLVITAKHHDGFAMYRSSVSDYNIVDWTPFDRDPLRELAEECRKQGIRFCIYYSHREDWDEPLAYGNTWDFDFEPEENLDQFEQYLDAKAKPQVKELIRNYGPFGLIWFDRGLYTQAQAREFVTLARELQPDIIINGRVGSYNQELVGDYQNMGDNGMPVGGIEEYWETPQTLNETWGYSRFDERWKSATEVIHRLVAIVSQGGNYLLNVGPTGEGIIPDTSVQILQDVGDWMQKYHESIYATTASPFPGLPWGWCTVKGQKLFLHVLNWPSDGTLRLPGMHNAVIRAYFMQDSTRSIEVQRSGTDVTLQLQGHRDMIDVHNTVIVLQIDGAPQVDPVVVAQAPDGTIELDYVTARTDGKAMKRFNRKGKFHISKMQDPDDTISWYLNLAQPGRYRVEITYAAIPDWQQQSYTIDVEDQNLTAAVESTGDWYEYKTLQIGNLALTAGKHKLVLAPREQLSNYLMYFNGLRLIPE